MGHDAGVSTPAPAPSPAAHRRSRLVLGVAWLLATVLAATVAWWAVTAVGRERGAPSAGLLSQAEVEQQLAEQPGGSAGPEATPGTTPPADVSTPGPAQTGAPDPAETASPDQAPAEPAPTDPGASADPGAGTGTGTGDASPEPAGLAEVARTWDVAGGQVAAVCTGATIGLLYATPAGGWGVEVDHAGPAEVEVEFRSGDRESRVRAECVAGTPELTRNESGGGGDDGGRDDRGGDDSDDDDD